MGAGYKCLIATLYKRIRMSKKHLILSWAKLSIFEHCLLVSTEVLNVSFPLSSFIFSKNILSNKCKITLKVETDRKSNW